MTELHGVIDGRESFLDQIEENEIEKGDRLGEKTKICW